MVLPMLFPVLYSCPVSLEHVLVYLVNYVVVLLSHCILSIASCRIVVHEQDSTRSILFIVSFIPSCLVNLWLPSWRLYELLQDPPFLLTFLNFHAPSVPFLLLLVSSVPLILPISSVFFLPFASLHVGCLFPLVLPGLFLLLQFSLQLIGWRVPVTLLSLLSSSLLDLVAVLGYKFCFQLKDTPTCCATL